MAGWMATGSVFLFLSMGTLLAEELPQVMEARLLTPLSSHSAAGTHFRLRVNGVWEPGRTPVLAPGSTIVGRVRKASSLGWGLRRERALIELDFEGCETPEGSAVKCQVDLLAIDNAREIVGKNNQIRGAIAASHPHSWLNGVWFRPVSDLPHRAALGLTGVGGMLYEQLAPTPVLGAVMIGVRLAFFRLPNTEIELPSGTDLIVRVRVNDVASPAPALPVPDGLDEEVGLMLASIPAALVKPKGAPTADVMNFAFLAGEAELMGAFEAAGWVAAEQMTPRTVLRTYAAASAMKGYRNAPVSPMYYEDRLPDVVLQKSFNSVAKRHHIRLWRKGESLWIGAATHDIAAAFVWKKMSVTHLIDPYIDREREKILNDLAAVGCLRGVAMLERPNVRNDSTQGEQAVTDGALAVVSLQSCDPGAPSLNPERPKHNLARTALRRVILETRHYLTRGSAYYLSYRMVRRTKVSWQNELSRQPGEQSQSVGRPRGDRSGEATTGTEAEGSSTACGLADGP